ncbi:hypothetical protein CCH79_00015226 [Gambusia affinis]|uniref:Dedicator of cytokinesis N-terminal domain-containing protein n=1 Tax=Gambusia affinis TaxID=33528 RepID=A0A315W319_GAMAF|nr:hypothetical protein CCH79_00015226 [Gambusia affinis]
MRGAQQDMAAASLKMHNIKAGRMNERFFVRLNKNGLPKWPEKTERQRTLFVDLGSSDLRKDVYIVVHITRIEGSAPHVWRPSVLDAAVAGSIPGPDDICRMSSPLCFPLSCQPTVVEGILEPTKRTPWGEGGGEIQQFGEN